MVDKEAVQKVFDRIKPLFLEHEGDFEVLDVSDDGTIRIKLVGECQICVLKDKTVRALEQMMKAENTGVTNVAAE